MKVCIIGCGAIGSLFGAHLGKLEEVEVWAYDPDRAHVEAINRNGLRLTGQSEIVAHIQARSDASEIPLRLRHHRGENPVHPAAMAAVAHVLPMALCARAKRRGQ